MAKAKAKPVKAKAKAKPVKEKAKPVKAKAKAKPVKEKAKLAKKPAAKSGSAKRSSTSASRSKPTSPRSRTKQPLPRWTPIPVGAFLKAAAADRGFREELPQEPKPSAIASVTEESLGARLARLAAEQRKKEEEKPPPKPVRSETDARRPNDRQTQREVWESFAGSQKTGSPEVLGRLKVAKPRLQAGTRRPHITLINTWRKSIKHSEFWRARDGSYHLIATFKGVDAFEQMERAFRRLPIPAYYAIAFFHKKPLDDFKDLKAGESPPLLLDEGSELAILKPNRTPTFAAEADTWPIARGYVFNGDRTLYEKKFGLAVAWPTKKAKRKKKRAPIDHGPPESHNKE